MAQHLCVLFVSYCMMYKQMCCTLKMFVLMVNDGYPKRDSALTRGNKHDT